ncbi:MAG: hypothetical protein IPP74_15410 [Alphaproteobacteria bacterium]|nr:hypothetical protein [Alphaproteobacteria bacterium]
MKTNFVKAANKTGSVAKESSTKEVTKGLKGSDGSSKFDQAPGLNKSSYATGSIKDVTGGCEMQSCSNDCPDKITPKFSK